ncbi:hypothetical protein NUW58_g10292 [Xylaria curta]|uniref:Uncharacterized protein n=1 Tax=Xylaria curta TaxID=42375 RepID=A0ACC1MMD9_9PEZI|nr:hypothetical protein NUW58_g10292 [Xylaria curta]
MASPPSRAAARERNLRFQAVPRDGRSIEVRATTKNADEDAAIQEHSSPQWDDRRNWVGFDDEMVIVLKESSEGRESLLVYDFT